MPEAVAAISSRPLRSISTRFPSGLSVRTVPRSSTRGPPVAGQSAPFVTMSRPARSSRPAVRGERALERRRARPSRRRSCTPPSRTGSTRLERPPPRRSSRPRSARPSLRSGRSRRAVRAASGPRRAGPRSSRGPLRHGRARAVACRRRTARIEVGLAGIRPEAGANRDACGRARANELPVPGQRREQPAARREGEGVDPPVPTAPTCCRVRTSQTRTVPSACPSARSRPSSLNAAPGENSLNVAQGSLVEAPKAGNAATCLPVAERQTPAAPSGPTAATSRPSRLKATVCRRAGQVGHPRAGLGAPERRGSSELDRRDEPAVAADRRGLGGGKRGDQACRAGSRHACRWSRRR